MKRSKEKIGIRTKKLNTDIGLQQNVQKVIAVLLFLSLSACEKAWHGHDGRVGDAFIALTWQEEEPSYLDAGTSSIPPVFYWGEYYKIRPGNYSLYYEGSVRLGNAWADYAWEVFYEIWEIPGEKGDWYYNGADGPDNFFTIECNPFGPYVGNSYKNGEVPVGYEIIEECEDELIVKQKKEGLEMIITYKKREPTQDNQK